MRIESVQEDQRQVWVLTKRGHGEAKQLLEPKGHTGLGAAQAGTTRTPGAARHRLRRPRRGGDRDGRRIPPRRDRPPVRLSDRDRAPSRETATCSGRTWWCGRRRLGCPVLLLEIDRRTKRAPASHTIPHFDPGT
ncbi:hypothetical protein LV779_02700 [Streptomyces thinghirensis]|nr:hypothetical protein [Streptomyces thinghirensis]